MSGKKDFQLFDNYEEDGQLSLFSPDYDDWDEDWVEEEAQEVAPAVAPIVAPESTDSKAVVTAELKVQSGTGESSVKKVSGESSGPDIRVKYCASCGKLLFVKEDTEGYKSECNNCGIKYVQKH